MCSIYGINRISTPSKLEAILKCVQFRGPDFSGIHVNKNYSFGHNRLKIIDLDSRANQPFIANDYAIVLNGEIYNYLTLKKDLIAKGHSFKTQSDTEVLLIGYMEYGEHIIEKLNGMFAFVIYDPKQNLFFGARDRLGKKPFYYYQKDTLFEFASQLKQFCIEKSVKKNIKSEKLFFRYGYIPEPYTIFKDIYKLEAGHCFTYNLSTYQLKKRKYWDISIEHTPLKSSYSTIKAELKSLLIDSVNHRLQTDVPLGVFLSGGIDSSLIASLVTRELNQSCNTFSVRFSNKAFDESVYAKKIANYLGTTHHTFNCNPEDMIDLIETLPHYYDEPFNDSSALPMMMLARETKKHVTVALSGDGGDELFWGYNNYLRLKRVSLLYTLPSCIRQIGSAILRQCNNYRLKRIADGLSINTLEELFLHMGQLFDFNDLFNQPNIPIQDTFHPYLFSNKPVFERISDYDIKTYLNGDIFTKVDRATMAFSLEARSPLVDYRLVEYSQRIPFQYKYKHGKGKYILKDILYDYIPKRFFNHPKSGFSVPLKLWFRKELKAYLFDTLTPQNLSCIDNVNIKYVNQLMTTHINGTENNTTKLWSLLTYIKWAKQYL